MFRRAKYGPYYVTVFFFSFLSSPHVVGVVGAYQRYRRQGKLEETLQAL